MTMCAYAAALQGGPAGMPTAYLIARADRACSSLDPVCAEDPRNETSAQLQSSIALFHCKADSATAGLGCLDRRLLSVRHNAKEPQAGFSKYVRNEKHALSNAEAVLHRAGKPLQMSHWCLVLTGSTSQESRLWHSVVG